MRERFARRYFPRSERVSAVYLAYSLFTPRYRVYRDLNTFDLREDARLGPTVNARVSRAASLLGSERDFSSLSAGTGWSFDLADGFQTISAGWAGRVEDGRLIDEAASVAAYVASPVLARSVRVVADAGASVRRRDTQNRFFSVGGETALRGYAIGDFIGRGASMMAHVEVRTLAIPVASLRAGALAFYDVGDAADRAELLVPHHDVGIGLRVLIPQLNTYVLRFDWAVPLETTDQVRAGFPGRLSAGFRQVF